MDRLLDERGTRVIGACLLVVATLIVPLLTTPARAGGSWLELRRIDGTGGVSDGAWGGWASAGSSVFMQGDFCDGQQADPSAGPWMAYLRRDANELRQPLGPVEIDSSTGNGCAYSASLTFVVPDVASGMYWVDVCADASCATGVGDLIGAMLAVASTRLEARALIELPNLKARLQREGQVRDRLKARVDSLRSVLGTVSEDLVASRAYVSDAKDEFDTVEAARDTLVAEVDSLRRRGSLWRTLAIVSLIALGIAVASLLTKVIRGRREDFYIPDTPGQPHVAGTKRDPPTASSYPSWGTYQPGSLTSTSDRGTARTRATRRRAIRPRRSHPVSQRPAAVLGPGGE